MFRFIVLLSILFSFCGAHAQTKEELFTRDSVQLLGELKQMSKTDQQYRKNNKRYAKNTEAQTAIDEANTVRLIEITETYGFPNKDRFAQKSGIPPLHVIWVHASAKHFDTIRKLIEEEKSAGRLGAFEYAHVLWHLNGRKEFPAVEGAKVKKKGKKTIITF